MLSDDGDTLYGLSTYGGDYTACPEGLGCGFVFSIDLTTNKYTVLHEFKAAPSDGQDPTGTLILDPAGNLYGMTLAGGTNYTGTIFEITAAGAERIVYSFGAVPDGNEPAGGLVRDSAGNLFGATISGGTGSCTNGPGCGTVFEVTPSGKEKVLHNFTGGTDGQNPYLLVGNPAGNVFGISRTADNVETAVFEVNSNGEFSIAYDGSFVSQINNIIAGPSGTLYGEAYTAGISEPYCDGGCGEVFQLTPTGGGDGTVTILHAFDGTDGDYPDGLVLKNGILFGSTGSGGSTGDGIIFKLKP